MVDCEIEEGSLSWLGAEIKAGIKMFGITVAALFFVIWLLQDSIWGIVISSVFLIVGALMLFLHLKPLIAQKKLGKVNVEIEEKVYWAGDSLTVGLSFCTDKGIRINRITARLVVLETAVTYSIKNRVAQEYQKVAAEQQLVLQQAFAAGQAFKQSVSLVLPDDAMHNFNYGYNTLAWTVELDIDIADWPSWQKSLPIVVVA
ncbi:MAG: hypothetical protein HRT35_22265 [Algicola sp.]|nr:hypothetical protein [Algicola sp.]